MDTKENEGEGREWREKRVKKWETRRNHRRKHHRYEDEED